MRVNCREQIANPAEPVNGQDERRKCAAVDSPARLCCSVIKRATAQNAAALCHYSERGIFHDRTRKVSRTYPVYTRCLLQDCSSAGSPIVCKDYSAYYLGGGIDDSLKATRYARGMLEVDDQFAEFDYVVKDNQTGWKYIFEVYSDLVEWAKQNSR